MTGQLPMFPQDLTPNAGAADPGPPARRSAGSPPGRHGPPVGDLAPEDPVARVVLMVQPPHLDREFDYLVPAALAEAAVPGVRVRVRLAGRLVDGFVVARAARIGQATVPLRAVLGPPVLIAPVARLCRAVADRYAGTMADVLRAAVPPRHARAERALAARQAAAQDESPHAVGLTPSDPPTDRSELPAVGGASAAAAHADRWCRYDGGAALIEGLATGVPRRVLWVPLPGEELPDRIADLIEVVAARERGSIVAVPDGADVERFAAAISRRGVPLVRLSAAAGPQTRYRAFLRLLGKEVRVVVGTRSAVFAPVADLALMVVWDDLDESMQEGHAPGWHAREVAALRCADERASLVLGGPAVSMESARMAATGWLSVVAGARSLVRSEMPRVRTSADQPGTPSPGRIPGLALSVLREALVVGPALVVVPRGGYLPLLACSDCREVADCATCGEHLLLEEGTAGGNGRGTPGRPQCPTHGAQDWRCPQCLGTSLRAAVVGIRRTAEELGRAVAGAEVVSSTGDHIVRALPADRRCLVIATPGAVPEPGPPGYAAAILLDAGAALSRPGQRVGEQVVRTWFEAAGRVRGGPSGGQVLVVGDPGVREVAALVRWDPLGYADRELAERRELRLAPAVRVVSLAGPALAAGELAAAVRGDLGERIVRAVGPVPRGEEALWMLAVSIADGPALAASVRAQQAMRSMRRVPVVRSRIDSPV